MKHSPFAVAFLMTVLAGALAGTMAGCASKQTRGGNDVRRSSESYDALKKSLQESRFIAPGNTISVEHSGDSKISGTYKVDFDGKVQMPYKVTLQAGGMSTSEFKDSVQRAYQSYVRGSSTVEVEIKDRKVFVEVRGEVQKPGRYLVRYDTSLEEVVAEAGGFITEDAGGGPVKRPDYLGIQRPTNESDEANQKSSVWFHLAEYFFEFDTEPDFLWRGGEKLFFQRTAPSNANIKNNWQTISIMGEVKETKELPVLPNADLLTYISRTGGVTTAADLSGVEIIHRDTDTRQTVNLVNDRMTNGLRAGDVVIVRAVDTRPSIFDKIMSYALTLATVSLSVAALIVL